MLSCARKRFGEINMGFLGRRLELQAFFFVTALVVAFTHRIGPNK